MNGFSFDLYELWHIAGGQLILLGAGLVLIFLDLWLMDKPGEKRVSWMGWVSALLMLATLGHVVSKEWNLNQLVFMDVFSMDKFSAFIVAVVLLSGVMSALLSMGYLRNNNLNRGEFFVLADEDDHKVKRIVVAPGQRLSLQRHRLRDEHWLAVSGCEGTVMEINLRYTVLRGDGQTLMIPNAMIFTTPLGVKAGEGGGAACTDP